MKRFLFAVSAVAFCGCQSASTQKAAPAAHGKYEFSAAVQNPRQFTMSGKRAGEGYFSDDGRQMIFQSERDPKNPFYQMYVMNLDNKGIHRVSDGTGKTTCGWIHPDGKRVIFSSTHEDPNALKKQKDELDFRASGKKRRYSWDYDENYDIYIGDSRGRHLTNLTRTLGYDAEGSISPDGTQIAFASNRLAYTDSLSAEQKAKLEHDPASFMDIYIMNLDGSNVRRLTTSPGYDGGPFFSPDGRRIVWRRFSEDGMKAEIYTMKIDGSDQKQITHMGAMSWAPFYHPSGDYLIFTSNVYGYDNFELFIVDVDGAHQPVRVTDMPGFDGLPVFMPDGHHLAWARQNQKGESQIHMADWNDGVARKALGLAANFPDKTELSPALSVEDAQRFVNYLASENMKGRATGSPEERIYMQKIQQYFKSLGLSGGYNGHFNQTFSFRKGARMGTRNELTLISADQKNLKLGEDWQPLSFSKSGESSAAEVVFAGYGLSAPADAEHKAYSSYTGLDVKDKWVMVFRYVPEDIEPEMRQWLLRYSRLEHKALVARELGARGLIIVNGPNSGSKGDLVPFHQGGASGDSGVMAITMSNDAADSMLHTAGKKLKDLQNKLDKGETVAGFGIPMKISSRLSLYMDEGSAQNTLGLIRVPGATYTVVIGAHGDHLGKGHSSGSLMNSKDKSDIHYGADDNASGVAGVLELAHYFQAEIKKGNRPRQNILFAVWSGEELGDLGSSAFLANSKKTRLKYSAYINMDMIGRLTNAGKVRPLAVQGVGSSTDWKRILEKSVGDTAVTLSEDPYLPTDAMAFYVAGVPVLSLFSGVHTDYHTPRDTPDKIDYQGLIKAATVARDTATALAWSTTPIQYTKVEMAHSMSNSRGFRIFLGTIPDYASPDVKGVKLSGVIKDGPAEKAGLQSGDVIVKLATFNIKNINDYVYSLESLKPNEKTTVTVIRDGASQELTIVPTARE